jgi:hypothetical protein
MVVALNYVQTFRSCRMRGKGRMMWGKAIQPGPADINKGTSPETCFTKTWSAF